MSASGMRWGDSCSSDEDEIRVQLRKHEPSSSESEDEDDRQGSSQPPARFASRTNCGKNNNNNNNRRGSDDRWENRGVNVGRGGGRGGRGGKQGPPSKKGPRGKKGGKQNQFSVTIGASEWKEMAKGAKKYGGESNASTVEGGNWMALRQKKANERKDLERQKRGQELKEKRKNQTEALRAAVEQKKKENSSVDKVNKPKQSSDSIANSNNIDQPKKIISSSLQQRAHDPSINQLEQKMASHSLSSGPANTRPKLNLKPRTLPVPKTDVVSTTPGDDSKDEKSGKDNWEKKSHKHDSEEDESIVTASSRSSLRGDKRGDRKKRSGRGRGRGKGPQHNNSSLRQTKSNNAKKDRIPHKKPIAVKGDLMPNGTVRLSKHPTASNDDDSHHRNVGKKNNKARDSNKNLKAGGRGEKNAHYKKCDKNSFRQVTRLEIGGGSSSAQYSHGKSKTDEKASN